MTNGDKIRAMTDDEIADQMEECPPNKEWFEDCVYIGSCKECRLDWLKQEAQA